MKKMLFIMNPYSGQKKTNKVLTEVLYAFTLAGYQIQTFLTTGRGSATQAAREFGGQVELVVCSGGDGTLNETINGLLSGGHPTPLGYIPSGTTNDFAASLGLSGNPIQAARDIIEGSAQVYDVGLFGERNFAYVASFGAFTRSSYQIPQNIKNALGHVAYVLGGISEISQLRKEHVRMEIDGETVEDDFLFGAICNATSIGGILSLDPKQVDLADGRFEIMLVRRPQSLIELAECITAVQNQEYNSCAMITFRSAKEIRIWADPQMPWTLDGEREEGHSQVLVRNLHQAIHIVHRPPNPAAMQLPEMPF